MNWKKKYNKTKEDLDFANDMYDDCEHNYFLALSYVSQLEDKIKDIRRHHKVKSGKTIFMDAIKGGHYKTVCIDDIIDSRIKMPVDAYEDLMRTIKNHEAKIQALESANANLIQAMSNIDYAKNI